MEIFFWWQQILAAVKAVHDHGIVHCDLKPQNFILFRRGDHVTRQMIDASVLSEHEKYILKLCDFGVSRELEDSATHVSENFPIGTIRYMAPEVVHDCRSNGKLWIGKAADNWSSGVILHQMLHLGLTPHSHIERLRHRVKLLLAIADENSARAQSSCPRLLQPSTGSLSHGNEQSAARLASARHAALMSLQSGCLQFSPQDRASTQDLVSFTDEKARLFFGPGEHELPLDDPIDGSADVVGYSGREVLLMDRNDDGAAPPGDVVGMFVDAQAGEEPRGSSPGERPFVPRVDVRAPDEETSAQGSVVIRDGARDHTEAEEVLEKEGVGHQVASGGNNEGATAGTPDGNGGASGTSCGNDAPCDAVVESSSLSRQPVAEAGDNSLLSLKIVDPLEAEDNSSVNVDSNGVMQERTGAAVVPLEEFRDLEAGPGPTRLELYANRRARARGARPERRRLSPPGFCTIFGIMGIAFVVLAVGIFSLLRSIRRAEVNSF